jgi:drug/metabolite transporter (DMT)-like permease
MEKVRLDMVGAGSLLGVTLLFAINQVIVVEVNKGLQPVFFAGLRSVLAAGFVWLWLWTRGRPLVFRRRDLGAALLMGSIFAVEFLCLFMALDLTTLGRASVMFYTMPIWLALMAHVGLPGERIGLIKGVGLLLAFCGTAIAILSRQPGSGGSLAGDLLALGGAIFWAGTAFIARKSSLREVGAEMQLLWMVIVSGPLLLVASLWFGPLIRDLNFYHILGVIFQSSVVVAGGFVAWLWLLSVYPAAVVASFSFLTPIFSLMLGSLLYGEVVTLSLLVAAAMVAVGIVLINQRKAAIPPAPIEAKT